MRAILCPADTTEGFDARLETALALARAMGGHVSVPIASPIVELAAFEPFGGGALTTDTVREMRAEDEALAKSLEARLARDDVPYDVGVLDGDRFGTLCAAARCADLIVLSRDDAMLEDLVLGERCPVLALPPRGMFDLVAPRVMIAWDGSRPAANAMKAALPLLAHATGVDVVTINGKSTDGADNCGADTALRYLSRHEVHAELHVVPAQGSVAQTLLATATELGSGLLVMGLYGHSRLRELLVGGVTREMISNAGLPLLLSH
ncbi:universal stress protein [Novosphingobium sp.]|uniref:universal stress protein n=1 Tax=Novosphingobium sp. TaxID=1874826 RepID=UPI0025CE36FA|nr:universal stress protein [Novosphingobium sp.]